MYKPEFPYLGNQAIISSGRVINHSYDDFIFLFGFKGVAVSSPSTFTVDANEKTIIASPQIQLGYEASQPVLLGKETATQLGRLLDDIKELSNALAGISAQNLETSIPKIVSTSQVLASTADQVKKQLNSSKCLSQNTFTK